MEKRCDISCGVRSAGRTPPVGGSHTRRTRPPVLVVPLDVTADPFIAVAVVLSQQKEFKLANYYCRVRRRYVVIVVFAEGATGYELTYDLAVLTSENPAHNMC